MKGISTFLQKHKREETNMSKGEELIVKILNKEKVKYEREKTFSDLRNWKFRYDFYIENLRGRRAIIEFNGVQHYEPVSAFYSTMSQWYAALERDRRKISYALANDILIYEIPYWDVNKLTCVADLFKPQYLAHSRWHNDEVRNYRRTSVK